jgi:hypothetical protein
LLRTDDQLLLVVGMRMLPPAVVCVVACGMSSTGCTGCTGCCTVCMVVVKL